jgi:hypothetical protein
MLKLQDANSSLCPLPSETGRFLVVLFESQNQNLDLTVLYLPSSLDSSLFTVACQQSADKILLATTNGGLYSNSSALRQSRHISWKLS